MHGTRPGATRDVAGFLPDLCTPTATFPLVLLAALIALALTVARSPSEMFWGDLGRLALFCEFLMLASAAVLCLLRRPLGRFGVAAASTLALVALVLTAWAVAEGAWFLLSAFGEPLPEGAVGHVLWIGRVVVVAAVVDTLVLRYLYVSAEWRENVRREAGNRLEALTARIRPHFLFNTLNTAAALVADQPVAAERTLEDLAELFRASLRERGATVPFAEEVEIVHRYLAIESLRLGERLRVEWDVAPEAEAARIPPMVLQTLVENAVTHGIESRAEGGVIRVRAQRDNGRLVLVVDNPLVAAVPATRRDNRRRSRHGIGLAGVRARLALAYSGEAALAAGPEDGRFVVRVDCPWSADPAGAEDADPRR